MSKKTLRTPTKANMVNSEKWLNDAIFRLEHHDYHRVKMLCRQVIRALKRGDHEQN